MAPLVWLVTGATSGIGLALISEITARGDKVIAAGRRVQQRLGHLEATGGDVALLELDITAGRAAVSAAVAGAWAIFGGVDVLVNNAGVSALKAAEEATVDFVHNMFQVNLFGHMRVVQAALPLFRAAARARGVDGLAPEKKTWGRIAFTSSSILWAPLPFMSHYAASKAGLSAYVEALHKEVRPLGIRCVAIECGGFPTSLGQPRGGEEGGGGGAQESFGAGGPAAVEAYGPLFGALTSKFAANPMAHMPGDVAKAAARIVDVVRREGMAAGKPWAVRVALGSDGMGSAKQRCEQQLTLLERWRDLSLSTDREEVGNGESVALKEMFEFSNVLDD